MSSCARRLTVILVAALSVVAGCSSSGDIEDDPKEVEAPVDEATEAHVVDVDVEDKKGEVDDIDEEVSLDERIEEEAAALESDDDYAVLISQDGEYLPIEDHRVVVEPRPFEIHVVAAVDSWAAVNIRHDSEVLDDYLAGRPIPEEVGGPGTAMAERPFNESQHIAVEPVSLNIWGYGGEDNHRFDTVEDVGDAVAGTRRVASFFDVPTREATPLEAAGGMELHFLEFGSSGEDHRPQPVRGYTLTVAGEHEEAVEPIADEAPPTKGEVDRYDEDVPLETRIEDALASLSDDDYTVLFSQRGEYIPVIDDQVVVAPEPFEIHVVASDDVAALLNVSTDPAAWEAATKSGALPEDDHGIRTGQLATALPENPYNPMQRVQLHSIGVNAWGYMQAPEHRFDDLEEREDAFVGTRTVSQFHDVETDDTTTVGNAAGMEFYVVEFYPEGDDDDHRAPKRAYTLEVAVQ